MFLEQLAVRRRRSDAVAVFRLFSARYYVYFFFSLIRLFFLPLCLNSPVREDRNTILSPADDDSELELSESDRHFFATSAILFNRRLNSFLSFWVGLFLTC